MVGAPLVLRLYFDHPGIDGRVSLLSEVFRFRVPGAAAGTTGTHILAKPDDLDREFEGSAAAKGHRRRYQGRSAAAVSLWLAGVSVPPE